MSGICIISASLLCLSKSLDLPASSHSEGMYVETEYVINQIPITERVYTGRLWHSLCDTEGYT